MADESQGRLSRFLKLLIAEWREIGGLGRLALIGVVLSGALAVGLGFTITSATRGHLLDARAEILSSIIDDLALEYDDPRSPEVVDAFDQDVRESLLGGETVRVKVWTSDGTVIYSDEPALVGSQYEMAQAANDAFGGEVATKVSDLSEPFHAEHIDLGSLIEIYFPFTRMEGEVTSVLEVEQRTDQLEAALDRVKRNVWLSIGAGLTLLTLFLGLLVLARARDLNRRRRLAERVLGESLRARERERSRIVGSLHDDIGQPLYRLLYGLDGTKARMANDDPLREEVGSLINLVHQIDETLRAELRMLHHDRATEAGLEEALTDLVSTVSAETDLDIALEVDMSSEPDEVPRQAVFRSASEALTNIRKHASAASVLISVRDVGDSLVLSVEDDGSGGRIVPGLGLTTSRERLESIGGSLEVTSRTGRGTLLTATAPMSLERS